MTSILESFQCFVFDVDRTIADNNGSISPSIIGSLRPLIEYVDIAIVTARSIHEGLELLAHAFFHHQSGKSLYFFPASAAQAYRYDADSGSLLKLYDKAKSDVDYQKFRQYFRQTLIAQSIEIVDEMGDDDAKREAQIHDRIAQITIFFSHNTLREAYIAALSKYRVNLIRHGRSTLHVLPFAVNKHLAIDYLQNKLSSRLLVFADGFYEDKRHDNYGNDLSLAQYPLSQVTCVNVGQYRPKLGMGVFYDPNATVYEAALTDLWLRKILQGCTFAELGLVS